MKINGNPDGGGGREPIVESLSVTQNGIYTPAEGVDGFDNVDVNVPAPEFVTETLSVSVNNTYYPGQGVDGFSQVVVDVPQSVTGFTEKNVTEGIFDIVNMNNSASFVKDNMFGDNNILQTVYLPDCQKINAYAFVRCKSLTQINLPVCQSIYNNAFQGCNALQSINIPECKFIGNYAFAACSYLQSISLPVCQSIQNNAFGGCFSLQSISLPACQLIQNDAFNACSSLQSISLPACVDLRSNVFRNCTSLEEVTLTMDDYAHLSYNNTLTGTKIASGIGSIYVQANDYDWYISASGWSSLSARFVSVPGPVMLSFSDGLVYGDATVLRSTYSTYLNISSSNVIELNLPKCSSVEVYQSLTKFSNLKTVKLGSVTTVSNGFFPSNVESVDLPACETVLDSTFSYFSSLSQVSLPVCISVGNFAFKSCYSLQSISLPACTSIGQSAFQSCSSLSWVSLPVCQTISYTAFSDCISLESINLPVCERLGDAFAGCRNLTTVDLGVCSNITYNTFKSCSSVTTFILRANTVCYVDNTNFQAMPLASFYVPASLVDAYKTAQYWSQYSSRIFPIPE